MWGSSLSPCRARGATNSLCLAQHLRRKRNLVYTMAISLNRLQICLQRTISLYHLLQSCLAVCILCPQFAHAEVNWASLSSTLACPFCSWAAVCFTWGVLGFTCATSVSVWALSFFGWDVSFPALADLGPTWSILAFSWALLGATWPDLGFTWPVIVLFVAC